MTEYESVKRGWAYIGEDGILRANPNAPHPRNCGLCGKPWHDDGCDMTTQDWEWQYGTLASPPMWLAVVIGIGVLLALLLLTVVLVI